jgi:hypothetical protein
MGKSKITPKRVKKAYELLTDALKKGVSVPDYLRSKGYSHAYVRNLASDLRKFNEDELSSEELQFMEVYSQQLTTKKPTKVTTLQENLTPEEIELVKYDAFTDDNYDDRSYGDSLRENSDDVFIDPITGKPVTRITRYFYCIKIKGEADLTGYLTRDEMDMVYRLYSNLDGAGLTVRAVSRHFNTLTYRDFKRILRAFNITKQSIPVAPHVLEEETDDKLMKIIFGNKENLILKKLELERGKYVESLLKETQRELVDLKENKRWVEEVIRSVSIKDVIPFTIDKKEIRNEKALMVYLSDQHVGADNTGSLYPNHYDEKVFNERLQKTLAEIATQVDTFGIFDRIIICNLGDALDGYNGQTTRGGHKLPQNLDNKGQFDVYVKGMLSFFDALHTLNGANHIDYYCVSQDNHSGSFGYVANRTLEMVFNVKYPEMKVKVFDKFINFFTYGDHAFMLTHGKDDSDRKYGLPLILDMKTELYINEYIDNYRPSGRYLHLIKGDLHQSAVQFGKRFRYKNVASQFGSSKWIHNNFGNTPSAVDMEVVYKYDERLWSTRLTFQCCQED